MLATRRSDYGTLRRFVPAGIVPTMSIERCQIVDALDPSAVGRAAQILANDGIVALPTETVYGLGASLNSLPAISRVYRTKGRPLDHPLIVHIAERADISRYAIDPPALALQCAEYCWPGPLTMLVHRSPMVPDSIVGGRATVALRIPANDTTREVIRRLGHAVAAPSANLFGRVSPTTAEHVCNDLGPAVDLIIDGGPCIIGLESTIVDFTTPVPTLLRPGGMPVEDIESILGVDLIPDRGPSRASGMLPIHYQPKAQVCLANDPGEVASMVAELRVAGKKIATLDHVDRLPLLASTLYAQMRHADDALMDVIVALLPPPVGLGRAIRDRLERAAAH